MIALDIKDLVQRSLSTNLTNYKVLIAESVGAGGHYVVNINRAVVPGHSYQDKGLIPLAIFSLGAASLSGLTARYYLSTNQFTFPAFMELISATNIDNNIQFKYDLPMYSAEFNCNQQFCLVYIDLDLSSEISKHHIK